LIRNRFIDILNLSPLAGHLVLFVNYLGFRNSLSILRSYELFIINRSFALAVRWGERGVRREEERLNWGE